MSTKLGVLPYCFEPEASDSEFMAGRGGEVDLSESTAIYIASCSNHCLYFTVSQFN